ncbi:hypothetical protein Tco_0658155, partial [Tanacetum coccineum]
VTLIASSSSKSSSTKGDILEGGGVSSNVTLSDSSIFMVEMHRGIAWDKVENPNPQSTPQVLPSFEEYTPPVTHMEEVEETIGILIEPLPNCPPLDVNLRDKRRTDPPIKPHSLDSFRIKVVDKSTINTSPSPHVAYFHPKDTYCYYHPCIDDPKKHYGFIPGLLGHSRSLGVGFLKLEMIEDDLELESKKVSFLE